MRIIRSFNNFKRNKINEELTPMAGEIKGNPDMDENEIEHEEDTHEEDDITDYKSDDDMNFDEEELEGGYSIGDEDIDDDIDAEDVENKIADEQEMDLDNGDEEEGDEYIGQKLMNELGDMLDAPVINNSVSYAGKTINFYSETEKFHVDNKQFDTPQEVYDYLMSEEPSSDDILNKSEVETEEESIEESKSYRAKALRRKKK